MNCKHERCPWNKELRCSRKYIVAVVDVNGEEPTTCLCMCSGKPNWGTKLDAAKYGLEGFVAHKN